MKSKGFTLIELMIVVAIIAIVAAIAIPNLIRSRMSANETAAVAACKTFCTAEDVYRRTDYNLDGVLEYAQTLSGTNSLYELVAGSGNLGLIDKSFADAEGVPTGTASAKSGYVFNVLRSAGPNASGGARNFVDGSSRMTLGYGLSATPNQYDGTGRNSFIIDNGGTIYETDLGIIAVHPFTFDPSTFWVVAE